MTKIAPLVCLTFAMLALAPKTADASMNNICTVTSVYWGKYSTPDPGQPSAVPTDILNILCDDGISYGSYIGSPSQVALVPDPNDPTNGAGCYASPDAVKEFATLATAALLSGRKLDIWWTQRYCPGAPHQHAIESVTLHKD